MGKYFKYAIGEILLVVIGILIALQINNWNEKKKEAEQLKNILTRVTRDFENNSNEITNTLKVTNAYIKYINTINSGLVNADSLRISDNYFNKYASAFGGFEDIKISTDGINLLKTKIQNNYDLNNDTVEALLNLYNETLYEIEIDKEDLMRNFIILFDYVRSTGSFFQFDTKNDKSKVIDMILEDQTFKIYLNEYRYILGMYLFQLENFQKNGTELMAKIKAEYDL